MIDSNVRKCFFPEFIAVKNGNLMVHRWTWGISSDSPTGFSKHKSDCEFLRRAEADFPDDMMVVFIMKHGDCCTKTWLQQHIKGAKSERNAYSRGFNIDVDGVCIYIYIYIIWFIRVTHIYIYIYIYNIIYYNIYIWWGFNATHFLWFH